jgi:hypothetical protein
VKELRAIPQELLNDPRLEGILFLEKSYVRRNYDGSYDVAKLFEGIHYDKVFEMEDQPKAENWELDYQGYLVRTDGHDEGSGPENGNRTRYHSSVWVGHKFCCPHFAGGREHATPIPSHEPSLF